MKGVLNDCVYVERRKQSGLVATRPKERMGEPLVVTMLSEVGCVCLCLEMQDLIDLGYCTLSGAKNYPRYAGLASSRPGLSR
jgi:hypothetical protein